MEIHQKKAGPEYHRLKTVVKKYQDLRIKNFEARNGNSETKRRGQESGDKNSVNKGLWEIVGSGMPTGSVLKETTAVSVTISISVQN